MGKKSFLDSIDTESMLNEKNSPFSNKSKQSKPVQVRKYQYDKIKRKAFDEDKKIVDIVEEALDIYIKKYNL